MLELLAHRNARPTCPLTGLAIMVQELDLLLFDCPCCGETAVCVGERPLLNCEHCGELVPVPVPADRDGSGSLN